MRNDDGVGLLDEALARIHGEKTMPNPDRAVELQRKSVTSRTEGRIPAHDALIHWRNPAISVQEAISLMEGWSLGTAYRQLGRRDVPAGRRGKK